MSTKPDSDAANAAHWSAVEEATELLVEERYVEALVALRDVIKRDRTNPYAYHYLGVALFETAQLEPARDAYRAALRLAPDYLGARVGLSHVLRMLGDIDGAIAQAKEALRRFPRDEGALHAAGLAHAARGNKRQAKEHLTRYLATNPEMESALEVRQILEMLGIADDDGPVRFD